MIAFRNLRVSAGLLLLWASAAPAQSRQRAASYYPGPHPQWEHRAPGTVGIDARLLDSAIAFAKASESPEPRDLEQNHYLTWGREPHSEPVGPFATRGPTTGVIVRNGYIVAEWGEPARVDMTFSVTKSFLSSTVAVALERGIIRDVNDVVRDYVPTGEFDSEHNRTITWDHLLRQTSDWEGTLWGKPDWADRPPANQPLAEYVARKHAPGHRTSTTTCA
jgi:CubicO group peptidase (beta-lactamase class C family)